MDHFPQPSTVSALRARLADLPGDTMVVLAADSEGNQFSPLADIGQPGTYYRAFTPLSGAVTTHPDIDTQPCLVLWPTY